MYYMYVTSPFLGGEVANKWFNMNPISAGWFGVPVGIIILIVVSLLTPKLSRQVQELVEHVHYPNLQGDINTQAT